MLGIIGTTFLAGRRIMRAGVHRRPLGVAALASVVSFLVLCLLQEYIELAGKVVAWTMLGVTVAAAYGLTRDDPREGQEQDGVRAA